VDNVNVSVNRKMFNVAKIAYRLLRRPQKRSTRV